MSLESFIEEIPEAYYRKAIDLNRYSNSVARELMQSYERVVRRSIAELERIEQMPSAKRPQVRAQRLKALIKQNTEALANWSNKAGQKLASELSDLAKIEVDFTAGQLRRALPDVAQGAVRTVEVTPAFAEAVITADPTNVGTAVLSDNLEEVVSGPAKAMKLTARQGAAIRMPDGRSIGKAFRGLAEQQAQIFATTVQDGLLSGESTQNIARTLIGEGLEFSTKAKSIRQLAQAGGQMTKMATHQVRTLVRTSVNATSNVASQRVYKANPAVTKKYRWLATLDEKTSPICRSLDQQVFEYGKGPTPANPPHFNCRSTTVPVVDWDGLSNKYGIDLTPPSSRAKRPSASGGVPLGTSYGKWLHDQRPAGKKFEASAAQAKALNGGRDTPGARQKAKYFNRLADKYGPDKAMKKFLRDDGTEVSLADLKKRYGEPERITATKTKAKPKPKTKPTPAPAKVDREYVEAHQWDNGKNKLSHKAIADSLQVAAEEDGLAGRNMRQMMEFQRKKEIQTVWSTGREKLIGTKDFDHWGETEIIAALRKGNGRGKEVVMAIADDLEKGRKHPFMNKVAKVSSSAAGHTVEATHLIVMRQEAQFRQLTKDSIARVRESVKFSVQASVEGRPVKLTGADLYKRTGKTTMKTEDGWINTYVHEMGHQVHFRAGKPPLRRLIYEEMPKGLTGEAALLERRKYEWRPSQYGMTNENEQFAETFTQYVFAPDELKKANPTAYRWVEEAMKEALK